MVTWMRVTAEAGHKLAANVMLKTSTIVLEKLTVGYNLKDSITTSW